LKLALYRECRPARFAEIVGQDHVTRTLRNAVAQGRLAHAYLFCGPRGTGKTTTARVLAKALNCPHVAGGEPCGECETCVSIASGDGVDVVEMDAASNRGIDEIRSLRERVRLAPVGGRYKVYVIDEVHMLTTEAFNALLKTIEEPPGNVVFILCTTEIYRVPATIVSRCQRFDFHPVGSGLLSQYLIDLSRSRRLNVEPEAARFIARVSTGSFRDALSILDQCLAYSPDAVTLPGAREVVGALDGQVMVQMADALIAGNTAAAWGHLQRLLADGRDPRDVTRGLAAHLRDLLLFRLAGSSAELVGPGADDAAALERQAGAVSEWFLYGAIDSLTSVETEMRYAPQPRLALEARLLRLCAAVCPPPRAAGLSEAGETGDSSQAAEAGQVPEARQAAGTETTRAAEDRAGDQVEPSGRPAEMPAAHEVEAAWTAIMKQLPAPTAGFLHGSRLSWENGCAWISVPGEVAAQRLNSGGHLRIIRDLLGRRLGRAVQVSVRLQGITGGLFDTRPELNVRKGTGRAPGKEPRGPRSGRQARGDRPEAKERDDSLASQAEAMFAAEEVDKGDEQGDEPR